MKTIFVFFIIIAINFVSCNHCRYDDCPMIQFEYTLLNSEGNNLFTVENSNYKVGSVKVIWFREGKEIEGGNRVQGNIVFFEIMTDIDSVWVQYNENEHDVFIYKNLTFSKDKCCGLLVDNFNIELNGKEFCVECAYNVWTIEK